MDLVSPQIAQQAGHHATRAARHHRADAGLAQGRGVRRFHHWPAITFGLASEYRARHGERDHSVGALGGLRSAFSPSPGMSHASPAGQPCDFDVVAGRRSLATLRSATGAVARLAGVSRRHDHGPLRSERRREVHPARRAVHARRADVWVRAVRQARPPRRGVTRSAGALASSATTSSSTPI